MYQSSNWSGLVPLQRFLTLNALEATAGDEARRWRGTRGNLSNALKEPELKYFKITNESIRATQEAIATTSLTPGQDSDNCIDKLTRLHNLLTEGGEPMTDRHFTDIVLHGLMEENREVKLMTWKDAQTSIIRMFSLRHLYLNKLSQNKTKRISGFGTPTTATSAFIYYLILVPLYATTAARRGITGVTAPCLPRPTGNVKVRRPEGRKLYPGGVLGRSGALCIGPHTMTPRATHKGLRAHRRVVCTRRLKWEPKPAPIIPGFYTIGILRGMAMVPPMAYHDIPTVSHGMA